MSNVTLSTSASQNLYSLTSIKNSMDDTSYILSTGKKVNSALDDPIAYFAAATNTQRSGDLSSLKDAMGEGIQTIKAASEGIDAIEELISDAKSLAKSALSSSDSSEVTSYMNQFNELLDQIDDLATDSEYQGVNLLGGTSESLIIVFDEDGNSSITISGVDASSSTGLSLTTQTDWTTDTAINTVINALDSAKSELRADAKTLSTQLGTVENRQDYTEALIKTLDDGAANLVNADTNSEATKLTTLQTQQSLAIQALSITNSSQSAVLSLFQ